MATGFPGCFNRPRPAFSVLDKKDLVAATGIPPVHWRRQLRQMLRELVQQSTVPEAAKKNQER